MIKELMNYPMEEPLFYKFLVEKGYSRQQLSYYSKVGWLERTARGVYKRKGVELDILRIIKALQEQLSFPFTVGGMTALALQEPHRGASLPLKYYIYKPHSFRLNNWLKSFDNVIYLSDSLFNDRTLGLITGPGGLIMSLRERAILELADQVDTAASYREFMSKFELLGDLRDNILQQLLENCTSIKTKRLFLQAAENSGFNWFDNLDLDKIYLGQGPRQVDKSGGGEYNKKYNIIVPKTLREAFMDGEEKGSRIKWGKNTDKNLMEQVRPAMTVTFELFKKGKEYSLKQVENIEYAQELKDNPKLLKLMQKYIRKVVEEKFDDLENQNNEVKEFVEFLIKFDYKCVLTGDKGFQIMYDKYKKKAFKELGLE